MQKKWNINLHSWILEDGNYPAFYSGKEAEFACSFGAKKLAYSASSIKSADLLNECNYRMNAEVVYIDSDIWILDFGILAYSNCVHPRALNPAQDPTGELRESFEFQQTLKTGQMISAELSLSIDYYVYFEHYCKNLLIPPMIYKWHLDEIEGDFRKMVRLENGAGDLNKPKPEWREIGSTDETEGTSRVVVRLETGARGLNKPKPEWRAVGSTGESAWQYLLHCDKSNDPPHRDGQRLRDLM